MPRPLRFTGSSSRGPARSTAALTLLTVTGATAVWAVVQVAEHAPRPGHGDLSPTSVTSSAAPDRPASRRAPAPPGASTVGPATTGAADPALPGTSGVGVPGTSGVGAPGTGTAWPGHPMPHHPAPGTHAPAHAPSHKPAGGAHSGKGQQGGQGQSGQSAAWIRAECARRFPGGPRRSACVTYLQQAMGR
ncbi:hypothetical protein J4573_47070 [Actinomadura barringtoniae]|uniref:Uncharacterized protein n=1 Tax=Actinomadura barringtoniae TaxID=1427535 RepID=A0A939PKQ2_9ACTN|nr:hypothetical protein [Actinomadura barringtoniae]MBO2454722.1 hypothetical protein [Actinomadura barringtoniae]